MYGINVPEMTEALVGMPEQIREPTPKEAILQRQELRRRPN